MSGRLIYSLFSLGAVLLLAVILCLPVDFMTAAPVPTKEASDLAVLPGDCIMFVTIRLDDLLKDSLARSFSDGTPIRENMESHLGVPLADVERMTIANVAGEVVTIIRTRKPFDEKKVLAPLAMERTYRFKDKDGGAEKPQLNQKKINGKTIHFVGEANRWTRGVCIVDRQVFMTGALTELDAILNSKVKRSAELTELIGLAGKHTLAAGFEGKQMRAMIRRAMRRSEERYDRKGVRKDAPRPREDTDKREFKDKCGDVAETVKDPDKKEMKEDGELPLPLVTIPFKPLIMMKMAFITVDVNKGYTAHAKITYDNKDALDDGEVAVKMLLYIAREFGATMSKAEPELHPLAPLEEPIRKAFKAAKLIRKDNTLETSVSLTISDEIAKKVKEEMEAVKKRREERFKDRDKDKDRFKDKR